MTWPDRDAVRAAFAPLARVIRDLTRLLNDLAPATPAKPGHRAQPRTLHSALTLNARPALQVTDRRPARTPATRRR